MPESAPIPKSAPKDAPKDAMDILARTLWGEARGEGTMGMAAVACVILNRARKGGWWGADISSVCLKPMQFSCWNAADPNLPKLRAVGREDEGFFAASVVALLAVGGALADITGGATHYHARGILPNWAEGKKPCFHLDNHLFYRRID